MGLLGIKPRLGNVRFFAGLSDREEGRAGGVLAGFTTYAQNEQGQETYLTSYSEIAGRSDHIAQALAEATGVDLPEQLVSEAGDDVAYVGTPSMNKPRVSSKDKADAIPATAEVAA